MTPEQNAASTPERTRLLIVTEGDGQPVYRRARTYSAKTAVHRTPIKTNQSGQAHSGVRLTVEPSGPWRCDVLPQGVNGPAIVVASGDLTAPQPAPEPHTAPPAYAVRKFLDIAIGHLPTHLHDTLNGHDGVTAYEASFGWWLWVPQDPDGHAADYGDTVPAEVLTIQRYARECGCDYVMIDRDSSLIPGLPVYDEEDVAGAPTVEAAYVWNNHTNQLRDWCPWSGKPTGADVDPDDEATACPAVCPASRAVEASEYDPDDEAEETEA